MHSRSHAHHHMHTDAPHGMTVKSETAAAIMSTNILTCSPHDTISTIKQKMSLRQWDSLNHIYVITNERKLVGIIETPAAIQKPDEVLAVDSMQTVTCYMHPHDDQEKAVFLAISHGVTNIPVVTKNKEYCGAITDATIINIMHSEHLEDTLITVGIRSDGSNIMSLLSSRITATVGKRAPWLIAGALAGIALGFIASLFEGAIEQTIAVAYFVPVIAYIADSVGNQTNAITIRAITVSKIKYIPHVLKELAVGILLGAILGSVGGLGALLITGSGMLSVVVGLSLLLASMVSTVIASSMPIMFKSMGKDPALGSGPLATAAQDILSVLIYFALVIALL